MTSRALFARIDAAAGHESEVERLLMDARSIVAGEAGTTAWFALHFGRGEYGIFDAFPDDAARDAHLGGGVVAALRDHADLLDGEPHIETVDVIADKLPPAPSAVTKGLLLRLPIKPAHADDAVGFLRSGEAVVANEPATTAWFAIRFGDGEYGVFDVFPDNKGRRAHLLGDIPRLLALHGLPWLSGLPHMAFTDVIAQKL